MWSRVLGSPCPFARIAAAHPRAELCQRWRARGTRLRRSLVFAVDESLKWLEIQRRAAGSAGLARVLLKTSIMHELPPSSGRTRWLYLALVCATACGVESVKVDPNGMPGDDADEFLSHVPGQSSGGQSAGGNTGGGGAETADSSATNGGVGAGAERAIAEADIIQLAGDRLYALSQYAGLSIIDVSQPAALKLLGRHRINATPFEMYLQGDVAYVMFNDYASYEYDEQAKRWVWQSASRLQALDVKDPENVRVVGDKEIPGSISDSRQVGDVVYLVTYENGYCWRCEQKANTRVVSFDVSDDAQFVQVDELRFENETESWGPRSISVTPDRIYVGGPSWEDRDSSIQVVDIHDPGGELVLGAEVPIRGSIESRWQIDEYQGVLRVISQPTPWRSNDPPYVQTFTIESSSDIQPLASLPITLPRPEDLRSVRFDGPRAYAVTFEQIDPFFTFDLSDPAAPKQMGELEIPGFVYHMEPRGDRVYALGYDWGETTSGALHVSIFDVSDLTAPALLDRVNFGGDWASLAEDQDRIHKAFNILLDQGLILVPFSGGSWEEETCHYEYQSGIQLVDVDGDDLTLRGVAPQVGSARRALLHREHMIGVTDNAVQVFDIADRDNPEERAQLDVARNISQLHVMGDTLLRFGTDWWTDRSILDFTRTADAQTAEPLGELDLMSSQPLPADECNSWSQWEGQVFVHGDTAYVPRRTSQRVRTGEGYGSRQQLVFYIVDLGQRDELKLVGSFEVETDGDGDYLGGVVLTDHALLVGRGSGYYSYDAQTGKRTEPEYAYDIFDLSDPHAPELTKRFEVPSQIAAGGWGWGAGGCGLDMAWGWWFPGHGASGALVASDLVVSQHEESVDDGTGRVRYFLDRLDVSDPAEPKLLAPINIPGQVVHYDAEKERLVTLDYLHEERSFGDYQECYRSWFGGWFDDETGLCHRYNRRANVLAIEGDKARRISLVELDSDARASAFVAVSDERVFFLTQERDSNYGENPPKTRLETLAYTAQGRFERLPTVPLERLGWWWGQVYARGERAFIAESGGLSVIDTHDRAKPVLDRHELSGWGCSSLEVAGDKAYCALGEYGVVNIDL